MGSSEALLSDNRGQQRVVSAVAMCPSQSLIQPGSAHSVSTSANPASLPPTEIETINNSGVAEVLAYLIRVKRLVL